jgi:hypothetical protein
MVSVPWTTPVKFKRKRHRMGTMIRLVFIIFHFCFSTEGSS